MQNAISDHILSRLGACVDKAGKMGAAGAKIHYRQSDNTGCQFEAGRLKSAESRQNIGYGIEVLKDGRLGRASGNNLDDLEDMLDRAISLAKVGSAAHFDSYPVPSPVEEVKTYSSKTAGLSVESLIESSSKISDKLKEYNPDLFIAVHGSRGESSHALVTSGGVIFSEASTGWSLSGFVQRTEGTDIIFSGCWRGWRDMNELFDPDFIVSEIIKDLERSKEIVEPPVGELPIFVHPEGLQMFLWPVILGVNGRSVAKGESPLKGRLGEQVLDKVFTIVDDPHRDYDNGANVIDDNGIPTRKITIFNEGVLETFLYDLDSAGLAGAEPTGSNNCSPYSTTIPAGTKSKEEMISEIEDGLYVKDVVGFGQSNIQNGDFSCNVNLGFRIKNGKIVGRVKDVMIAGNVFDMLKQNVILSSDTDPIVRMPFAVIPGVHVSAK